MKKLFLSCWIISISLSFSFHALAQDPYYDSLAAVYLKEDSLMLNNLEAFFESDSSSIFDLIDSLLKIAPEYSQLSARLGYTSNIANAGRDFGFSQYGLNSGISYYHKSGLYSDISGYWNSDASPTYNPTITSLGYLKNITNAFAFNLSYDHYFYNKSNDESDSLFYYPLTNALNNSLYLDLGKFTFSTDYSYLFGQEQANRIRGNVLFNISKKKWGFIDKLSFIPNISVLFGDQNIYYLSYTGPGSGELFGQVYEIMTELYGSANVFWLWRHDKDTFRELYIQTYQDYQNELVLVETKSQNVFGLMNYSISFPVYLYIKNFTFSFVYHLNMPVALPGEDIDPEPNSYIGTTLIYTIPFFKK